MNIQKPNESGEQYILEKTTSTDIIIDPEHLQNNELDDQIENDDLSVEEIIQKNVSKNIRDLRAFFSSNNFITEKGNNSTNIINVAEKKTYHVPPTHIERFFALIESCRKESRLLHYAERQENDQTSHTGIMIDFDRYQKTNDIEIIDRHFDSLTRFISKLLHEFIEFKEHVHDDKFVFHIFYIRKPGIVQVEKNNVKLYKDGFHILIPEIQVTKRFKKFLFNELCIRGCIKN